MVELPEEKQVAALKEVAAASARRADVTTALNRATDELREAALNAARTGAGRVRIKELAGISSKTLYAWLNEAGIDVRAKRG